MFYLNQEARNGLWNFISAHFSMVYWVKGDIYSNEPLSFYLDDSQIKETIEPYYMARIVDVEQFLKTSHLKPSKHPFTLLFPTQLPIGTTGSSVSNTITGDRGFKRSHRKSGPAGYSDIVLSVDELPPPSLLRACGTAKYRFRNTGITGIDHP